MGSLFVGRSFCILGAFVVLAGCGVPEAMASPPGAPSAAVHAGASTWMLPEAKQHKLLYISDPSANSVYVYIYPGDKLVGTLTGFNEPWGMCSDGRGNVFIADVWNDRLVEYAHGGTTPIATLTDDNGHPTSCSFDPSTGNLAGVYYFLNEPSRTDEVAVYAGEQGSPQRYTGSQIGKSLWSCTYDDRGDLFVDGLYGLGSLNVGLAELPRGGNTLVDISLAAHIAHLSSIQWTGRRLAIGDQGQSGATPATIFQLSLSGTNTSKVGATQLTNTYGMQQFWVERHTVAASSESTSTAFVYNYPGGGAPTRTISGIKNPFGITVSKAQ